MTPNLGIVVEFTGGHERRLVLKLAEAGLPVVVANPRRVRSFGQGMGILAKTDASDARPLALFGEKAELLIRPILQGTDRLLADLVARRRQIVARVVAEKNRRDTAADPTQRTIEALLRTLSTQVREIDRKIEKLLLQDAERAELSGPEGPLRATASGRQGTQARLRRGRPEAPHHPRCDGQRRSRLARLDFLTSITFAC